MYFEYQIPLPQMITPKHSQTHLSNLSTSMYIALRRLRPKMTIFGFAIMSCWWNFGFFDLFAMENHTRGQILELFSKYLLNTMSLQTYHRLLSTVGGVMTDWLVRNVFIVNLMHGQSVSMDRCIPLRFCIPHSTSDKVRAAVWRKC